MIFTFPCIIFLYNTLLIQHVIYFTYLFGLWVNIHPLNSKHHESGPFFTFIIPALITVSDTWKMLNRHSLNKSAVCLFWVLCDCLPFGTSVSHLLRWQEGCGKMPLWPSLVAYSLSGSSISHVQEIIAHPLQPGQGFSHYHGGSKSINVSIVQAYKRLSVPSLKEVSGS